MPFEKPDGYLCEFLYRGNAIKKIGTLCDLLDFKHEAENEYEKEGIVVYTIIKEGPKVIMAWSGEQYSGFGPWTYFAATGNMRPVFNFGKRVEKIFAEDENLERIYFGAYHIKLDRK